MHRHRLGGVLLKLGSRQAVGAQAAIGLFPERRGEGQPAGAVDDHAQRRIAGRRSVHCAGAQMVEISAAVFGDADHVAAAAALRDVDEKAVAGLLRQKAKADDLAGRWMKLARAHQAYWLHLRER